MENNKFFQSAKKELTPQIARELLQEGKTLVKGLYSEKKQKEYDAMIALDDTGQYVNFKACTHKIYEIWERMKAAVSWEQPIDE